MKKFLLILLVMCVGFQGALQAQTRTVTGTVTGGDDNLGIPRANVTVKGTTRGTPTDLDGNYSIEVSAGETLVFSFIGYVTQEILVGNQTRIDVALQPDFAELGEVIVIGYGQVEAKDATGAIASVKAEDFNGGVIASPEQLIQGKVAGVQITSASGEPGAGVNIRIRGTSSVRGGNNPLFVVDGIPLSGENVSPGGADIGSGSSTSRNPLNFLNPNDIASIDILKDASATAIYGSRGANGVVIITTKSGTGAGPSVEYGASFSISEAARTFDLLGREDFLGNLERFGSNPDELDFGASTDWQDLVLRKAFSTKHDLAYGNSYDNGSYRVSVGYDNQDGIVENSNFERISGRLNINHSFLDDKLNLGAQVTIARVNDRAAPVSDNAGFRGDVLGMAYSANPTLPGFADSQIGGIPNPLAMLKYVTDNTETDRSLINLSADYDINDKLNFRINAGFDNTESFRGQAYSGALNAGQDGVFGNGRGVLGSLETSSNLLEAFFNYDTEVAGGTLTAVAGYSYQEFNTKGSTVLGWGFDSEVGSEMVNQLQSSAGAIRNAIGNQSFQQFGFHSGGFFINQLFPTIGRVDIAGTPTTSVRSVAQDNFESTDELQSFFGRVNFTLNDKYIFTATLRADGSTRFGGDNKYGFFPSAAAAWRLSDEDFIPDLFTDLKLRVGFGVTGNQEIPHNLHQARVRYGGISINDGGDILPPGVSDVAFRNPNLQWEETAQWNAGFDIAILDGRLSGTFDVYYKNTTDLLIQITSAQPAPQPFFWENLDADVINQGIEITLNYLAVDSDDFTWDITANVAYNENEVRDFDGTVDTGQIFGQGLTGAFAQRIESGQPLFAYFLREFGGFDAQGNTILLGNGDEQVFLGQSALPDYNVGLSTTLKYKGFDLAAFFNGQFGQYLYNNTANGFFTAGSYANGRNVTRETILSGEGATNNPDVSTRFLEKGDFLRLQNLALGYSFDTSASTLFKSLRLYVNAQNLFVLTDYTGLDPEVNTNSAINGVPSLGIDNTSFPRPRVFTLGLNATF